MIKGLSMDESGAIGTGALIDLVSDFYAASMDGRFWPTALAKLREAIGAQSCALASHDFARGQGTLEHAVGIDVDSVEAYQSFHGLTNPWLRNEDAYRGAGAVVNGDHLIADSDARQSDFYSNWLKPLGLSSQLFGVLERQGSRMLFLYAARVEGAAGFGRDEESLLARLLPYMQRGQRVGQMLRRTQSVRQAALDALEVMPIGVLLVGNGGAVLGANRVARNVMANREGISIGRNGLEFQEGGRRVLLHSMISDASRSSDRNRSSAPLALSIQRPSGGRPLSALVWPMRESGAGNWDEPGAIVFIGDPEQPVEANEERLRALYGLTGAEARVASLLARGYRLDEISETLNVAYETTRKHLKQIFSKTTTARQAELVRMVMTGPGGLVL